MLQSAPEPAQAELRQALVATERGRALVADPRPLERALGRDTAPNAPNAPNAVAAAVLPPATTQDASVAPPTTPPAPQPTAKPPISPVVAGISTDNPAELLATQHSDPSSRNTDGQSRGGNVNGQPGVSNAQFAGGNGPGG